MAPVERACRSVLLAGAALMVSHLASAGENELDADFLEFLAADAQDDAPTQTDPELVAWLHDFWNPGTRPSTTAERTEEKP